MTLTGNRHDKHIKLYTYLTINDTVCRVNYIVCSNVPKRLFSNSRFLVIISFVSKWEVKKKLSCPSVCSFVYLYDSDLAGFRAFFSYIGLNYVFYSTFNWKPEIINIKHYPTCQSNPITIYFMVSRKYIQIQNLNFLSSSTSPSYFEWSNEHVVSIASKAVQQLLLWM